MRGDWEFYGLVVPLIFLNPGILQLATNNGVPVRFFLLSALALALASCGSIKTKKKIELKELPEGTKVSVFDPINGPNFDYEVICNITLEGTAISPSELKDYHERVAEEARKCGTDLAVIEYGSAVTERRAWIANTRLHGAATEDIAIHAAGVRRTSDFDQLTLENAGKLVKALGLKDPKVAAELLAPVNKDPKVRSSSDSVILEYAVYLDAHRGHRCSKKSQALLLDDYQVRLHTLKWPELSESGLRSRDHVLACGKLIERSSDTISDRTDLTYLIHNSLVNTLEYFTEGPDKLAIIAQASHLMPKVSKEIKDACAKEPASELCAYEERFKAIKKSAAQLGLRFEHVPETKRTLAQLSKGIEL